jgi:hypothetical protein
VEWINENAENPIILEKMREWADDTDTVTTIIICFDSDTSCLFSALNILSKLEQYKFPILVRMTAYSGLVTLINSDYGQTDWTKHVNAFGMTNVICTPEVVVNEKLDTLAKEIHRGYVKKQLERGRSETDASIQPWHQLTPDLKDSNRQQADHIEVKLRAINCYSSHAGDGNQPILKFSDEEEEILARMEHSRWNAERFLAGWKLGPKDVKNKLSPYLVDWKELPENIKEYDREAVRNIPDLLEKISKRIYRSPQEGNRDG